MDNRHFCARQILRMYKLSYPYPVRHAQLSDEVRLAYVDEGQGQPLLFIHGLGSNLKGWWKNIEALKKDFRCLALDLPGYGHSGREEYPFSMSFFAEAVLRFIEKLGLGKVALIGHSMGGQVALHTVLRSTKNIEKLVLLAPAGFETFDEKDKKFFSSLFTPTLLKATPKSQIVRNFEMNFVNMPDDARFMIDDRLAMRKTEMFDHYCRMIPQCLMGMLNEPVYKRLPHILLPTLILYGKEDQLIPSRFVHPLMKTKEVAEKGHHRIPFSELMMVKNAGHFLQWEQAEVVNERVRTFLK